MKNLILLLFLFYPVIYFGQTYKLLDKYENSDFNYPAIDSIDFVDKGLDMLNNVFNPIKGDFTIYRFITKDYGILFGEYKSDLNNLIILKVNSKGDIIDGFQYFLQNPQMPSKCYLYRVTTKKIKIQKCFSVSKLKLKRVINKDICDENILPFLYKGKLSQ